MSIEVWIAVGALAVHAVAVIVAGIWQLGEVRADFVKAMAEARADFVTTLAEHRAETSAAFDTERRLIGETMAALRTKIVEVEIWGRDNFVRRENFVEAMRMTRESMEKIEGKLDRLLERLLPPPGPPQR